MAHQVNNLLVMPKTRHQFNPLEEEMAPHSSILA